MRKYVLIAFRTNDDKPMFNYTLDSITEITESKFLKFKEVGNAIIIHFGSSRNFEELKKYVNIAQEFGTTGVKFVNAQGLVTSH